MDKIRNSEIFNKYNNKESYLEKWSDRVIDLSLEEIPNDFDYIFYRDNNIDLLNMNSVELKVHYLLFGKNEGMKYKN